MKQVDIRRVLMVTTVFCFFLIIYLYYKQSSRPIQAIVFSYKQSYHSPHKKPYKPQWSWHCVSQRCERHSIKEGEEPTSLPTCSMLCGSTQLWPQPTGPVTLGSKTLTFHPTHLQYNSVAFGPVIQLLNEAYSIFNDTVTSIVQNCDYLNDKTQVNKFIVSVTVVYGDIVKLSLATDESYSLVVKAKGEEVVANVTAKTYFGARHGLETLSQLIWWDEHTNGRGALKILKGATVQDAPAFPYRGLMVDTSRNFMSVDSLKRVLVGMASNKLNVFHWHVSDSHSFPMVLPSVPQLAKHGSYSDQETYSPEEVKGLVEFARVRGIRVVLEVDTPAHAGNGWTWGPSEGLGQLAVCVNERPWSLYCGEPPCGQLNPVNPRVYDVLEKVYRDLIELSNENELFHIGGDEVNLECWANHIQKSRSMINFTDLHDLWGDFTLKSLSRLQKANKGRKIPHVIVWASNLSKRPYVNKYFNKENIIVQSWGASHWPDTPDLISDGYKVLISHVDAWYLDCGFGRWRETGDAACDPYRAWQTFYNHAPWQQMHLNKRQIIGGEACLWTEQVDETALDGRLWPRSAAFAERVWSDPPLDVITQSIQEDVYTRLNTQRERLVAKGIKSEALWPKWCLQNPGMCL